MKSRILTESFRGRAVILSTAALASMSPLSLVAADVTQTATNGFGTSSFASATSWSNGAAPSAANDYFTANGYALRTANYSGNANFAGHSLTLGANTTAGVLAIKSNTTAVITVNNLTLNNGELQNAGDGDGNATTVTVAGGITLASSTAANRINTGASGRVLIVTAPISGDGALAISGGGTATLSGTNSYGGGTSITGATRLNINDDAALGSVPGSPATNLTFSGSGTLFGGAAAIDLHANRSIQINTGATATFNAGGAANVLTLNGAVSNQTSTGNFSLATGSGSDTTGTVVLAGSNNFATGSTINLGGGVNLGGGILRLANSNALGSNAVTLNGAGGTSSWVCAVELSGGVTIGSNVTFNIAGHNQGGTGADNLRNVSGNNALNGAINIAAIGGAYQIDSAEAGSTLSLGGNLTNTLNSTRTVNFIGDGDTVLSGSLVESGGASSVINLVKSGAGTLTLSGSGSHTGSTTVNAGILSLTAANLADSSAVTIGSGGTLDLNFAGTDTVASLKINGSGPLPGGTYNSTHATYGSYFTGPGSLTVPASAATFATWASGLGLSGDPNADFDKDGIADATEYVLGSDPKAASNSGITGQKSGSDFIFTFNRADAAETSDITLKVQAGTTLAAWPQEFTIGANTAGSTAGVVVTENGAGADTVVVTIPTSAAAKLFARLNVVVTP